MFCKRYNLSATDIIASYAVPKVLLPMPPVGYTNKIVNIAISYNYGTTPFAGGGALYFSEAGRQPQFFDGSILQKVASTYRMATPSVVAPVDLTMDLVLSTQALQSAGDGAFVILVSYVVVQIT